MNPVERVLRRVDRFQQEHRPFGFVFGVVKKFGDDRGGSLAAVLAYYGFISLFPLLLVVVTVLGFVLHGNESLQRDLIDSALGDFPVIGTQLRNNVKALGGNGLALVVGLLASLWGALGVTQAAQNTMAEVWAVPERDRPGFLPRLARGILLFTVLGLAVVATTFYASFGTVEASGTLAIVNLVVNVGLNVVLWTVRVPHPHAPADLDPQARARRHPRRHRLDLPPAARHVPRLPSAAAHERGLRVLRDRPRAPVVALPRGASSRCTAPR